MLLKRIAFFWLAIGFSLASPALAQETTDTGSDAEAGTELPGFVVGVSDSTDMGERSVSGVVIGPDNLILTSSAIIRGDDEIFVRLQGQAGPYIAEIEAVDAQLGVALVRAVGAQSAPIATISDVDVAQGSAISLVAYRGGNTFEEVSGAVSSPMQLGINGEQIRFFSHNALAGIGNYGAGILNECGQLAAIGVNSPTMGQSRARRLLVPEGDLFALDREPLIDFLLKWSVVPPLADQACVTAEERAAQAEEVVQEVEEERNEIREELDKAREDLEDAKAAAQEAQDRAHAAREEAERLERQAEEVRNDADATEEERQEAEEEAQKAANIAQETATAAAAASTRITDLETIIDELEAALEAANRRLRNAIVAAIAAIVLIGGLAIILLARRGAALREANDGREQAEAELARRFSDIECRGTDSDGHPHAFKISGDALLKDKGGLIVGRQPTSSAIVFNHPEVSRNHFRVRLEGNMVIVEDLGSTNGTRINGEALVPGEPRELKHGDALSLGAIILEVTFHGA